MGIAPLESAIGGSLNVFELLLERGAPMHYAIRYYCTPLYKGHRDALLKVKNEPFLSKLKEKYALLDKNLKETRRMISNQVVKEIERGPIICFPKSSLESKVRVPFSFDPHPDRKYLIAMFNVEYKSECWYLNNYFVGTLGKPVKGAPILNGDSLCTWAPLKHRPSEFNFYEPGSSLRRKENWLKLHVSAVDGCSTFVAAQIIAYDFYPE
ncbi:unnamed protein product [Caenorhabditis sp. 36 PRJEB53466]|nr:unnamed protein product [Caenorhabditis sp. 36 PRJEB53466]